MGNQMMSQTQHPDNQKTQMWKDEIWKIPEKWPLPTKTKEKLDILEEAVEGKKTFRFFRTE